MTAVPPVHVPQEAIDAAVDLIARACAALAELPPEQRATLRVADLWRAEP